MDAILESTAALPEVSFAPGDAVITEGQPGGTLWVLVSGSLRVERDGVEVNRVERPGALVGEISLLLDQPSGATVVAAEPSVLRRAENGMSVLRSSPEIMVEVAVGLAERLHFVNTYLADLRNQYGDAPGLAMVPDVLRRLADRKVPPARPGSARDPDPEY